MSKELKTPNEYADFWRYSVGANIIPADAIKKVPKVKWAEWQQVPIPQEIHDKWKQDDMFKDGMAVICGKAFHNAGKKDLWINMIDCDNKLAIDEFCNEPKLVNVPKVTLVEQHDSPDKAHIYYYTKRPIESKPPDYDESKPKLEVKSKGIFLSYCTPSPHKDGSNYKIIGISNVKEVDADALEQQISDICKRHGLGYMIGLKERSNMKEIIKGEISEGGRHVSAVKYANHLIFVAKMEPPLAKHEFERWNKTNKPPLPDAEITRIFEDTIKYHAKKQEEREETENNNVLLVLDEKDLSIKISEKRTNDLMKLEPNGEFVFNVNEFNMKKIIESHPHVFRDFLKTSVILANIRVRFKGSDTADREAFMKDYANIRIRITGEENTTASDLSGREHETKIVIFSAQVVQYTTPKTEDIRIECFCPFCEQYYEVQANSRICENHPNKPQMKRVRALETNDVQHIYVRDNNDTQIKQNVTLRTLAVRGNYVNTLSINDTIKVVGIFSSKPDKTGGNKIIIDVIDVDKLDNMKTNLPSPELLKKIKLHILERTLIDVLTKKSFAYGIEGCDWEKLGLLMSTVRATPVEDTHNTLNIFLVGPPGMGKSTLLKQLVRVAPRAIRASGESSTGVGLTVSLIDGPDGFKIISPGVMVLASGGVGIVDEFDKMSEEHRKSLVSVMEDQIVHEAKGGAIGDLVADTAVILSANPRDGVYNPDRTITENIGLGRSGVPLIDRCDILYCFPDEHTDERDDRIDDRIDEYKKKGKPEGALSDEEITSYINWVNTQPYPEITEEAREHIKSFFRGVKRREKNEKHDLRIQVRKRHGLNRIVTILARMHGAKEADIWYAKKAIELFKYCASTFGMSLEELMVQSTFDKPEKTEKQVFEICFAKVRDPKSLIAVQKTVITEMEKFKPFKKPESASKFWSKMVREGNVLSTDYGYTLKMD